MVDDRAAQHPDNPDCLYPDESGADPQKAGARFRIILPTTHRFYYWELKPFFALFNHYWGPDQEVVVMGDGDPGLDYPNLTYFDMPKQFRIDGLWIMHFFSSGIRWYLKEHMAEDHFIMLQTDFWLTDPPDLAGLRAVKRYMEANPDVIRVGICPWPGSATNNPYLEEEGKQDGFTFYHCKWKKRDCFLQMSNIPAMWNRKRLHEVWKDGWDGWACEGWGSDRLLKEFPQYRSVIAKPPVFFWNHVSYTRIGKRVVLSNLPEEAREIVRPFVPGDFEVV